MSPFLWLLWGALAVLLLFVTAAAVAGVITALRKPKPCPWCGFDMHTRPPRAGRADDGTDTGR